LKTAVAVRVAATETVAVVPAVMRMSLLGTGISMLELGIIILFIPGVLGVSLGGVSVFTPPLTPGGALRSLGGATSGV